MAAADVWVDTAGFLALWDAADEHHRTALRLQEDLLRKRRPFVTSDYILDETVTLLSIRHSHAAAVDFVDSIGGSKVLRLEWVSSDRFEAAAALFRRHGDKEWSFTDCVSFSLMRQLRITEAFTTDHHFKQAGFSVLLGH